MLPKIESPTASSSQRTGRVGFAGLLPCSLSFLSCFHPQIRGKNWLRVTEDRTSAWQEKAKSAGRTVGVERAGCRSAYWDLTVEEKRSAEVLVVCKTKKKETFSQIWLANAQPFVWRIKSYSNDNVAYVACKSKDV